MLTGAFPEGIEGGGMSLAILAPTGAAQGEERLIITGPIEVIHSATTSELVEATFDLMTLRLILPIDFDDGDDYYIPAWQETIRGNNGEWFAPISFLGIHIP
jgi:hypothetical protein